MTLDLMVISFTSKDNFPEITRNRKKKKKQDGNYKRNERRIGRKKMMEVLDEFILDVN